ncbi:Crp/Fnr family transcriptional regulator [Agaricicola taiwanensis]|uniref:Crp/Fnr family transcriptional regulator n=1 Tax=Agaricicola taiwanensis TaxID=591372 RepID=UPI001E33BA90|nr:Crp/Fnr family transcriptional regulator [Agaricicola taiwanensis]
MEIEYINSLKRDHIRVAAGTDIIHPGQEDAEVYTLFAGWAFRYQELPDGRRQILNFLLPGDLIGLQSSLLDPAEHGVEALTAVELCVHPRNRLLQVFGDMPKLAYELTWLGAREQSIVDDNLTTVGQRGAAERVAAFIYTLYRRADVLGLVTKNSFLFPVNQTHIGDALGMSLVHTNKTIARLKRLGFFSIPNGSIVIHDPEGLARFAQYEQDDLAPRPII